MIYIACPEGRRWVEGDLKIELANNKTQTKQRLLITMTESFLEQMGLNHLHHVEILQHAEDNKKFMIRKSSGMGKKLSISSRQFKVSTTLENSWPVRQPFKMKKADYEIIDGCAYFSLE